MALPDLDGGGGQDENWETSPNSPKKPEASHLLHQLPQLPTPAIAGAGALCGDHGRADAFPVGGLGRGIQLPAFFWALEEGLWGSHGLGSRKPVEDAPSPLWRRNGNWRNNGCLLLDPWNVLSD